MLLILLSFVYFCCDMPYAIFLLLLPSLVYLPLLTCTYLYIYDTKYSVNTSGVNITFYNFSSCYCIFFAYFSLAMSQRMSLFRMALRVTSTLRLNSLTHKYFVNAMAVMPRSFPTLPPLTITSTLIHRSDRHLLCSSAVTPTLHHHHHHHQVHQHPGGADPAGGHAARPPHRLPDAGRGHPREGHPGVRRGSDGHAAGQRPPTHRQHAAQRHL